MIDRTGLRVGPDGQLPGGGSNYKGHQDVIGIIGNIVLGILSFHAQKNLY